jgi:methionine salvage enolase-phosphatase E1
VWVNLFKKNVLRTEGSVFVSDVRFPDELQACKELGFTTVRLVRDEQFRLVNQVNRDLNHASEIQLDGHEDCFDVILHNNGTLEDFYQQLQGLV